MQHLPTPARCGRADRRDPKCPGGAGTPMVFDRVTVRTEQMGGVPCIRGYRTPVAPVVGKVADGMTEPESWRPTRTWNQRTSGRLSGTPPRRYGSGPSLRPRRHGIPHRRGPVSSGRRGAPARRPRPGPRSRAGAAAGPDAVTGPRALKRPGATHGARASRPASCAWSEPTGERASGVSRPAWDNGPGSGHEHRRHGR